MKRKCETDVHPNSGLKESHGNQATLEENSEPEVKIQSSGTEANPFYSDLFTLVFDNIPNGERLTSSYSNDFTTFPFDYECFAQVVAFGISKVREENSISNEEPVPSQTESGETIDGGKPFKSSADDNFSTCPVATGDSTQNKNLNNFSEIIAEPAGELNNSEHISVSCNDVERDANQDVLDSDESYINFQRNETNIRSEDEQNPIESEPLSERLDHVAIEIKLRTTKTEYECRMCHQKFDLNVQLQHRVKNKRKQRKCPTSKTPCDSSDFERACRICLKPCERVRTLHLHVCGGLLGGLFVCLRCQSAHSKAQALLRHACAAIDNRKSRSSQKTYICIFCERQYTRHSGWVYHALRHIGDNFHTCPKCKKPLLMRQKLKSKERMMQITKNNLFMCNVCLATSKEKSLFLAHVKKHLTNRPYKYEECSVSFSFKRLVQLNNLLFSDEI